MALFFLIVGSYLYLKKRKIHPPNFLLICIDELRPELAYYGNDWIVLPNIDKPASGACVFKHHYLHSAIFGPPGSPLMTGEIEQGNAETFIDLKPM